MSIPVDIIAALCAKANDAALANEISIATCRVGSTKSQAAKADQTEFVAKLCAKASSFHLEDNRSITSIPRAQPCLSLPSPRPQPDEDCASVAASVSTNGHNIAEMHPQDMIAFARSIVTSPEAAGTTNKQKLALPPVTILTSRLPLDEASTTSSLTDGVDRVRPNPKHVLDSVSTDELLKALGKKLSSALNNSEKKLKSKIDQLINEEVATALADVLVSKKSSTKDSGKTKRISEKSPTRKLNRSMSKRRSNRNPMSPGQKTESNSGLESVFTANSPTAADDEISFDNAMKERGKKLYKNDSNIPSDEDLLAIGWKKTLDASSGRYYYYTLDRSQVVWDNPLINWFSISAEESCFDTDHFDESQFKVNNPFQNKAF